MCVTVHFCGPTFQGKETFSPATYEQEGKISFVVDAVYSFAHALNEIQLDLCNGTAGMCPELQQVDGERLLKYLRNISFEGEGNPR